MIERNCVRAVRRVVAAGVAVVLAGLLAVGPARADEGMRLREPRPNLSMAAAGAMPEALDDEGRIPGVRQAQAYPYPQPYAQPYAPSSPYVAYPTVRRRGPGLVTILGAVVLGTGAVVLFTGMGVYFASMGRALAGPYTPTLGQYAADAASDRKNQKIGQGLMGAGGILVAVGIIAVIVGRAVEGPAVAGFKGGGVSARLEVGPGSLGLNGRF
jgi:hypothetical protein